MAAGVEDLNELARLVGSDIGKLPSRKVLIQYRSYFRRYGETWVKIPRMVAQQWKINNPKRRDDANHHWKVNNRARHLLNQCRGSAKKRKQECTITVDAIEEMLVPMVCAVTGLPLTWEYGGDSAHNPWMPSIDRLDSSKGYVPGNVRAVCWAFNQMRGDFNDEVVMTLAKALISKRI
jgi:hypothetical protein